MPRSSWVIQKQTDDLSGLVLVKTASDASQLEHDEILVEMRAASLNYRDLVVAQVLLSSPKLQGGMSF
jgi:NADPH:quinone reductase-like Zn-dependent oxidoreductase